MDHISMPPTHGPYLSWGSGLPGYSSQGGAVGGGCSGWG